MHRVRPDRHPHEHELFRHGLGGQHQLQLSREGYGRGGNLSVYSNTATASTTTGTTGGTIQFIQGNYQVPRTSSFGRRHLHRRPVRR